MNIKPVEGNRVERLGVALGTLLYAAWRGAFSVLSPGSAHRRQPGGR